MIVFLEGERTTNCNSPACELNFEDVLRFFDSVVFLILLLLVHLGNGVSTSMGALVLNT